jgi:hypothetical protein
MDQNAVVYQFSLCMLELRKVMDVEGFDLQLNRPDTLVDGSLDGCPYDANLEKPDYALGGWSEALSYRTICMGARSIEGNQFSQQNTFAEYHANAMSK